jgi:alanyl-tRNA synthetase
MKYADARKKGVKALFEEKYGDVVRVLDIHGFSTELCGGTHAASTGRVGLLKIIRDEGIGAGVRRITAVCGMAALAAFQSSAALNRELCEALETDAENASRKIKSLLGENKALEKKNQELSLGGMVESARESLAGAGAIKIGDVTLFAANFKGASRDMLRQIGDRVRRMRENIVILLAGTEGDNVSLIGMASDGPVKRGVHAGNLVKEISAFIGGSGGGKPAMGQGGGKDPSKLREALAKAEALVRAQIEKN